MNITNNLNQELGLDIEKHTLLEDFLALCVGSFLLAFAINLLKYLEVVSGGLVGLALLVQHIFHLKFELIFVLINVPFYYFAFKKFGLIIIVKTFATLFFLITFLTLTAKFVHYSEVNVIYAFLLSNILIGISFLVLFRHGFSLGGIGLLALYFYKKYGISTGKVQILFDIFVLSISAFFLDFKLVLFSIFGVIILNSILILNHKPSRYRA